MENQVKIYREAADLLLQEDSYGGCCHAIEQVQQDDSVDWTPAAQFFQDLHRDDAHAFNEKWCSYWWPNSFQESQDERAMLLLLTAEAVEQGDL